LTIFRQVKYEDISRCTELDEIAKIIDEELTINELKEQLSRFGPVRGVELNTR